MDLFSQPHIVESHAEHDLMLPVLIIPECEVLRGEGSEPVPVLAEQQQGQGPYRLQGDGTGAQKAVRPSPARRDPIINTFTPSPAAHPDRTYRKKL